MFCKQGVRYAGHEDARAIVRSRHCESHQSRPSSRSKAAAPILQVRLEGDHTGCVAAHLCTNSRVLYAAHTPFPVSATKMEGLTDRISTTLSLRRMKGILNALAASESNVLASACVKTGTKCHVNTPNATWLDAPPRPPARRAANASCMFDSHHIPGGRSPGTYWDHKRGGPELPWLCQFVVPSGD